MDDKEKLEAIEKIINEKAEEMDDLPWSKREKTNKLLGGIKQSEYEKILKHTVTEFFYYIDQDYLQRLELLFYKILIALPLRETFFPNLSLLLKY